MRQGLGLDLARRQAEEMDSATVVLLLPEELEVWIRDQTYDMEAKVREDDDLDDWGWPITRLQWESR